jgi:1-acyl-sn-glycerol-3-phosphate acyltransferase
MSGSTRHMSSVRPAVRPRWLAAAIDISVTLLLWTYFTLGFVVLFAPVYVVAFICAPRRRRYTFQRLNHYFYRGFFFLCRLLMPWHTWRIDGAVRSIRSSVIVCNHASYIDPLLLIALFAQHTTIVKSRLLHIPVFGWMLKLSGYLPSTSQGRLATLMIRRMDTLAADLARGANLFVFPEGTRSRSGAIGSFNPGAFKIARLCRAPLQVVLIRNSDRLFKPGRFRFNACCANTISVELLAQINPAYDSADFSVAGLIEQVRCLMKNRQDSVHS